MAEDAIVINSSAYELLYHVWRYANNSKIFSWERLNRSMHSALVLAIDSGLSFSKDDFDKIHKEFRMGYWGSDESAYTQAVKSGNISACQALETFLNRKPFIAKFQVHLDTYGAGRRALRKEGRIAVGTRFSWEGKQVIATSFSSDSEYLIACSYKPTIHSYERKVERLYHISRKDLAKPTATIKNKKKEHVA
jgi:hypothetical protein